MSGLVYIDGAFHPLDQIERAPAPWDFVGTKQRATAKVAGKLVEVDRFKGGELDTLLMRPTQIIPAQPGTQVLRFWLNDDDGGEYLKTPVIAWALCLDGEVRPVTPHGVNDGHCFADTVYVEMPDGTVSSTSIHDETIGYDTLEEYHRGETERELKKRAERLVAARHAPRPSDAEPGA